MSEQRMRKRDQYGSIVPDDLVTLPDHGLSNVRLLREAGKDEDQQAGEHFRKTVLRADWYVVEIKGERMRPILASAKQLQGLSEDDPLDSGINLDSKHVRLLRVADALKRCSDEDGFYHA